MSDSKDKPISRGTYKVVYAPSYIELKTNYPMCIMRQKLGCRWQGLILEK